MDERRAFATALIDEYVRLLNRRLLEHASRDDDQSLMWAEHDWHGLREIEHLFRPAITAGAFEVILAPLGVRVDGRCINVLAPNSSWDLELTTRLQTRLAGNRFAARMFRREEERARLAELHPLSLQLDEETY